MSISGVVLHVRPGDIEPVSQCVTAMVGVEIHATTEDGRLVVTVDQADDRDASETLVALQNTDGVLSASLVYNYFEQDSAEKEEAS